MLTPLRLALLLAAALGAAAAHALEADRDLPFQINAAAVDVDQRTGVSVYRGNVVLTQGSMRIEADRVEVRTVKGSLTQVLATGKPVRLRALLEDSDSELRADAERVVYRAATFDVELTGNAWVRQGTDEIRARQIVYSLADHGMSATGADGDDGRVYAIIQPRKKNEKP
jgi:lipopolysaccharide export system protein LptA